MAGGVFEVSIEAPVERVWALVADVSRHTEFSPRPYAIEWTRGEPNAVGSRFRSVGWIPGDAHRANEGEVVENRPMERFALRSWDKDGTYANTFTLEPAGQGTRVTFHLVFEKLNGMAAVMAPVVFPLIGKKDVKARMQLLKARVEGSPPA